MAYPVLNFCPWQAPIRTTAEHRARVVQLLEPHLPSHRAVEIVLAVLNPIHVTDPASTMLYRLLQHLGQMLSDRPLMVEGFPFLPLMLGPRGVLLQALLDQNMQPLSGARVRVPNRGVIELAKPVEPRAGLQWQHNWREIMRQSLFTDLAVRRPEFSGIEVGIDKKRTCFLHEWLEDAQRKMHVTLTLTGAQLTQKVLCAQGHAESDQCPVCGHPAEDQWHMFWECPATEQLRGDWFPEIPYHYYVS